jgi:hypothetical protein
MLRSVARCGHSFAPCGTDSVLQLSYQLFTQKRRGRFGDRSTVILGFAIILFLRHKSAAPIFPTMGNMPANAVPTQESRFAALKCWNGLDETAMNMLRLAWPNGF